MKRFLIASLITILYALMCLFALMSVGAALMLTSSELWIKVGENMMELSPYITGASSAFFFISWLRERG